MDSNPPPLPNPSNPNPNTNPHPDPNTDPNTNSHPDPNTDPNTNTHPNTNPNLIHPNPNTNQLADHRVFTIYRPSIMFTSDSGATDILVTQRDASILTDYTPFVQDSDRPGFSIANLSTIYPIATGRLHIPHTSISPPTFSTTRICQTIYSVSPHLSILATPQHTLALDSPSTIPQITQSSTAPNTLKTTSGTSHFQNPALAPPESSFDTNKMPN